MLDPSARPEFVLGGSENLKLGVVGAERVRQREGK